MDVPATPGSSRSRAGALRSIVGVMFAVLVGFSVIVFVLLGGTDTADVAVWMPGVLVLAVVVAAAWADRQWLRLPTFPAGQQPAETNGAAHEAYAAHTVRALMVIEAPLIASILLAIITGSAWVMVFPALTGLAAIAFVCWPSVRNASRAAAKFEAGGARTGFLEDFTR